MNRVSTFIPRYIKLFTYISFSFPIYTSRYFAFLSIFFVPNNINFVFLILTVSLFLLHQSNNNLMSCLISACAVASSELVEYRTVSSAYNLISQCSRWFSRSLIYIKNNIGPKMET